MTHVFEGEGPGAQTSDGCSVELYRDLPYLGELDDILGELRNGSHILELGCGTGRLTRQLVRQGLSVTGVDNSAEMLAGMPREAAAVLCIRTRPRGNHSWLPRGVTSSQVPACSCSDTIRTGFRMHWPGMSGNEGNRRSPSRPWRGRATKFP